MPRGVGDPPAVPYHDLRSREQRSGSAVTSDLLRPAGAKAVHTINHPGKPGAPGLAARVLQRLANRDRVDVDVPGRALLDSVHPPLASDVLDALGLDGEPLDSWVVDGAPVDDEMVRRDHLRWYARYLAVVQAGVRRHHDVVRLLGLS